jgi:hypothetical protein
MEETKQAQTASAQGSDAQQ